MKDKHKIFDLLLDGKGVGKSSNIKGHTERFTDIMLSKTFGWTEKQINETSVDYYEDAVLILNMNQAKEDIKAKKK